MGGLFNRLAVQTALLATAVIAIIGAIIAVKVGEVVGRNEEARYVARIERSRDQLQEQITTFENLTETGAVVLANMPEIRNALAKRDVVAALQTATDYSATTGTPFRGTPGMQIYDAQGNLLVRAHAPLNNRQPAVPAEVTRVLRNAQPLSGIRNDELLGLVLTGIAPVRSPSGALVGAVEVMSTIDPGFTKDRAANLGAEVAILDASGKVIASSGPNLQMRIQDLPAALAQQQTDGVATVTIDQRHYLAGFVPLVSQANVTAGHLYVVIDKSQVSVAIAEARREIFRSLAIGLQLVLLAVWGGSIIAVRPIQLLVEAARRIQANDLESAIPVSGPAEIRDLGEALDDMRLAIREGREAILVANRDLATQFNASTATLTEITRDLTVVQAVLAHLSGERSGGLMSAVAELAGLDWADGALIAVATESGDLSVAAAANLATGAAEVTLEVTRQRLRGDLTHELEVADTAATRDTIRLAARGIGGVFILPMLTPDGPVGAVGITSTGPLVLNERRRDLLRSIAREVATTLERIELEDEVAENRRIAEAVLREMSDGVLVIDRDGVCRISNPAAGRLIGRPLANLVGQPWDTLLPLEPEELEVLRRRAYAPNDQPTAPVLLALRDRQIAVTSGPFPDPDPARSGMLVLLRDLSAEAEAERIKQDFVSMIGHELRTPLTLIRTTTDLLSEGDAGTLNSTQERIVEVLRNNSDRLLTLITELLDMSALDSGRMQINPALVELDDIVQGVLEDVQPGALAKQHVLRVEVPASRSVWADPLRVRQILQNLISNAIKYTPTGGVIELRAWELPGGDTAISVGDNGIGIPPEEQAHLFEKFYRTTAGRRATGGTGLGLAIARSLVELHGGRIWCESDGQSGSTFTFTLPRRQV